MNTDWLTRRVMDMVSRQNGATARDIRDCVKAPYRAEITSIREVMAQDGRVVQREHRFPGHKVRSVRFFDSPESADKWASLAEAPHVAPKIRNARKLSTQARPKAQMLDERAEVIASSVQPNIIPSGADHRFTVRELPDGYRSHLSASECRPWALAV